MVAGAGHRCRKRTYSCTSFRSTSTAAPPAPRIGHKPRAKSPHQSRSATPHYFPVSQRSRTLTKKVQSQPADSSARQDGYVACGCASAFHSTFVQRLQAHPRPATVFFAIWKPCRFPSETRGPMVGTCQKGSFFGILILVTFCSPNLTETRVVRLFAYLIDGL